MATILKQDPTPSVGRPALAVLAAVAFIFLLHWGAPFFIPLFVALLISFGLSPVVDVLERLVRWRVVAAAIVVLALVGSMAAAAYAWSDDVAQAWEKLPNAVKMVSRSVQKAARAPAAPITEIKKAAAAIENGGQPEVKPAPAPTTSSQMPMWELLWTGWKGVMVALAQVTVVLFLVFFMLASGDLFKRKVVAIMSERWSKRFTLEVINQIDQQVRRSIGVLIVANICVGFGTWAAFAMLGVEYAGLWGLAAGVIHTAPYFGPAIVAGASLLAAFVQFEDWGRAALVSGSSILVATLVGGVLATWLSAKRTRMNTTAAFVGLLFFGWLWGLAGVLLAIPLLAVIKTICDHNENWKPVATLLGR